MLLFLTYFCDITGHEFAKSRANRVYVSTCLPATMVSGLTCLHASAVYAPTCQKLANFSFLCANVPINVPRAKRRAIVLIWYANVPNGVPIFQLVVATCKKTCQFFKHSSYEMLSEISILYYHKIILHYTWCYSYTYHMYMVYST